MPPKEYDKRSRSPLTGIELLNPAKSTTKNDLSRNDFIRFCQSTYEINIAYLDD